ncbi:MAG: abortive infection family protein [Nitrospira sp.]|nr:abortive infection family protein [Nitrospira sp.]
MQIVPRFTIEHFAQAFAYGDSGFSLKDITPYFETFQPGVPSPAFDGIIPRKADHFVAVLSAMHPRNQRHSLIELCCNPPKMKKCPDEKTRRHLLATLVQADGQTPLAIDLTGISLSGVREQWLVATSRLTGSASSAVTAARTLLESTCKTVLDECGISADGSGDLTRLFNQTRDALGLKTSQAALKSVNEILSGLISVTNGLAAMSNTAGDRHGQIAGARLEDVTVASLCVHSAGLTALFLAQVHLERMYLTTD